jgi:hypothetical protein
LRQRARKPRRKPMRAVVFKAFAPNSPSQRDASSGRVALSGERWPG